MNALGNSVGGGMGKISGGGGRGVPISTRCCSLPRPYAKGERKVKGKGGRKKEKSIADRM